MAFAKGRKTVSFEAAFRLNPREAVGAETLDSFLHNAEEHIFISTEMVQRLSPASMSVMEFRSALDVQIAEKMGRFLSWVNN